MAETPGFIHLNCHSAYSLLEGALPLATLVKLAAEDGMPAVGVTDTANLFGALEFSEKAAQAGIQPIVGCKLPIRFEPEADLETRRPGPHRKSRHVAPLFLLAATDDGYRGLIELVTGYYLGEAGRAEPILLDAIGRRLRGTDCADGRARRAALFDPRRGRDGAGGDAASGSESRLRRPALRDA